MKRVVGRCVTLAPAVVAMVLSWPSAGDAQGREEGGLFLLLPVGAQAVGIARAMTAVSSPESGFWNPAGLAGIEGSRVLVYRGDHAAGTATGLSGLVPVGGRFTVGISYGLLDSGTQDLTDERGAVLGSITVRQHQAILSSAAVLSDRISSGLNLKWVQFRQSCRGQCSDGGVRAETYATDFGFHLRGLLGQLIDLGVLIAHAGPHLRVQGVDRSEPLPARLRFGAAYSVLREVVDEELRIRFLFEVEDRLRDPGDPALLLGSEVAFGTDDQVSIRGGYVLGSHTQTDGAAVGLGLRYERFELAIARTLARGGPTLEQEPVHLTLGFVF